MLEEIKRVLFIPTVKYTLGPTGTASGLVNKNIIRIEGEIRNWSIDVDYELEERIYAYKYIFSIISDGIYYLINDDETKDTQKEGHQDKESTGTQPQLKESKDVEPRMFSIDTTIDIRRMGVKGTYRNSWNVFSKMYTIEVKDKIDSIFNDYIHRYNKDTELIRYIDIIRKRLSSFTPQPDKRYIKPIYMLLNSRYHS